MEQEQRARANKVLSDLFRLNVGLEGVEYPEEMTATDQAHEAMIIGAKALAYTAIDLITDPERLERAKEEYRKRIEEQV